MDGKTRADIKRGTLVNIILKKDQRSGTLTEGVVKDLLTSAPYHSRGIKVRLEDGSIGRVAEILPDEDF
ncbi:YwbE family protein [Sphingobacterium chungjuense]|uniref:YwbE family protein n=1 Tax=Sphingobacterium chungjuense TaxID=2675553 RepID=UPI001409E4AE|nr:YwbE family protein [Sphingobacterium chungjuense]